MIQESNEDMCGMGISKQSESAKNDRYVSAGAKPEKNACKAEAQCICVSREPGMYCRVCFLFLLCAADVIVFVCTCLFKST